MPNQPAEGDRVRSFTCHDDLWTEVLTLANERGVPAAFVIRAALEAFVEANKQPGPFGPTT